MIETVAATELTTAGWIFFLSSWVAIFSLTFFCYRKILTKKS